MSLWPLCSVIPLPTVAALGSNKKCPFSSSSSADDHNYQLCSLSAQCCSPGAAVPEADAQKYQPAQIHCRSHCTTDDPGDCKRLHSHRSHTRSQLSSATCDHSLRVVSNVHRKSQCKRQQFFNREEASCLPLTSEQQQPPPPSPPSPPLYRVSPSYVKSQQHYSGGSTMTDDTSLPRFSAHWRRRAHTSQSAHSFTKHLSRSLLYYVCILVITFSTIHTSNGQQSGGGKSFHTSYTHKSNTYYFTSAN